MKLSEGMRLGSMLKPQAVNDFVTEVGTCAISSAMDACGRLDVMRNCLRVPAECYKRFPILGTNATCPVSGRLMAVATLILCLNDVHLWTREQIADWVETIERAQESTQPEPVAVPERVAP